jgi:hypothetical protein
MTAMLRRGLAFVVSLGLLAATGVASGTPCCTLTHLADRASVASPDCCDDPDCCRGEKRGPVDATLSAATPETEPRAAFVPISPLLPGRISSMVLPAFSDRTAVSEHPPPLDRSRTRLLISLFRI